MAEPMLASIKNQFAIDEVLSFRCNQGMISRVRASAIVVQGDKILTFRAIDPVNGKEYYFLPGGKIEAHETAPEAVIRETFEETGYRIRVEESSCIDKEYIFQWAGEDFDCLTLFYRGYLLNSLRAVVKDADYNKGVEWLPISEIKNVFAYSRSVLEAVESLV